MVCLQDVTNKRLTYDEMAKLALVAAEEHVRGSTRDAGIVALYAQVSFLYGETHLANRANGTT